MDAGQLSRAACVFLFGLSISTSARAETLDSALTKAFENNPSLASYRANLAATREGIARAKAGFLPRVSAKADVGLQYTATSPLSDSSTAQGRLLPRGAGLQLSQTLFDGGRTPSTIGQAEAQTRGAREALRNAEQNTIYEVASAYVDVQRDSAVLELQRQNVRALQNHLRLARERFEFGDVTRTDVSQAEAYLAAARSQASAAESSLHASSARYVQLVGADPDHLAPAATADHLLLPSLDVSLAFALQHHPAIHAAFHDVNAAQLQVRATKGELYPNLGLVGSLSRRHDVDYRGDTQLSTAVLGQVTIPIIDAEIYARARQAKEVAGQRQLEADAVRDQVRSTVKTAWAQLRAATEQIALTEKQVTAAERAFNGVREELPLGQRSTMDLLSAQQDLIAAHSSRLTAQRDRIISSYALARATGQLSLAAAIEAARRPAAASFRVGRILANVDWGRSFGSGCRPPCTSSASGWGLRTTLP
jgi:outer membrane protein